MIHDVFVLGDLVLFWLVAPVLDEGLFQRQLGGLNANWDGHFCFINDKEGGLALLYLTKYVLIKIHYVDRILYLYLRMFDKLWFRIKKWLLYGNTFIRFGQFRFAVYFYPFGTLRHSPGLFRYNQNISPNENHRPEVYGAILIEWTLLEILYPYTSMCAINDFLRVLKNIYFSNSLRNKQHNWLSISTHRLM